MKLSKLIECYNKEILSKIKLSGPADQVYNKPEGLIDQEFVNISGWVNCYSKNPETNVLAAATVKMNKSSVVPIGIISRKPTKKAYLCTKYKDDPLDIPHLVFARKPKSKKQTALIEKLRAEFQKDLTDNDINNLISNNCSTIPLFSRYWSSFAVIKPYDLYKFVQFKQ